MVDFEGEFAVVVGRDFHDISAADAMAFVGGYTIINDVSARNGRSFFLRRRDGLTVGHSKKSQCSQNS